MHIKGSRHMAAESSLKERELWKQEEIKKRLALSGDSAGATSSSPSSKQFLLSSKPLIERTRKAAFEALHNQMPEPNAANGCHDVKFRGNASYFDLICQSASERGMEPSPSVTPGPCHLDERSSKCEKRADGEMLVEQQARQERELKFTSAGWKRNCHGRWFRDENVEFDSDEEDPNISPLKSYLKKYQIREFSMPEQNQNANKKAATPSVKKIDPLNNFGLKIGFKAGRRMIVELLPSSRENYCFDW